jgi:hypothetical protein
MQCCIRRISLSDLSGWLLFLTNHSSSAMRVRRSFDGSTQQHRLSRMIRGMCEQSGDGRAVAHATAKRRVALGAYAFIQTVHIELLDGCEEVIVRRGETGGHPLPRDVVHHSVVRREVPLAWHRRARAAEPARDLGGPSSGVMHQFVNRMRCGKDSESRLPCVEAVEHVAPRGAVPRVARDHGADICDQKGVRS